MKPLLHAYKNYRLFVLILIIGLVSCSGPGRKNTPALLNGRIDLKDLDLSQTGTIILDGQWDFKWMAGQQEINNPGFMDSRWDSINLPGYWNSLTGESFGHGWIRVRLENFSGKDKGLYIPVCLTSYTLYINGEKYYSVGNPGEARRGSTPGSQPKIILLPDDTSITIMLFISNYYDVYGGLNFSPVIGTMEDLYKLHSFKDFRDNFITGIIFMMFIFHLALWFIRRKEKGALFFSFFCLNAIMRIWLLDRYVTRFFPSGFMYIIQNKLEYLTIPISCLTYILFYNTLFKKTSNKIVDRVLLGWSLTVSGIILIFPSWIYTRFIYFYQLLLVAAGIYLMICTIIGVYKKMFGARLLLVTYLIFFSSVIADIFLINKPADTGFVVQYGFLSLFFAVAIIFLLRFAKALHTAEYLSENLTHEVNRKTGKIKRMAKKNKDFFIFFSHETKTPLTLISNYFDKYVQTVGENEDLLVIKKSIEKLCRMVGNLSDFVKLEKGFALYNYNSVLDLSDIVIKKLLLFKEIAIKKEISIISHISKNLFIKADTIALDRILNNLLDNAVKYSNTGGTITVTVVETDEQEILLKIQNSGIGIPQNEQKKVFSPYYRTTSQKSNLNGIGIGLYIVKKIVTSLGAGIDLESSLENGTIFKICFKKYILTGTEQVEPATVSVPLDPFPVFTSDEAVSMDKNKQPILVVEDNRDLAHFLKINLEGKYTVFLAENGKKALLKLKTIPQPSLIISDIMMDEMTGIEFVKVIQEDEHLKAVPVIFLTAKDREYSKIEGLSAGAIDYVTKPFNIEELLIKVNSIVKNRETLKQQKIKEIKTRLSSLFDTDSGDVSSPVDYQGFCKHHSISEKEEQILNKVIHGLANKEIAYELNISINTVKKRLASIFKKTRVRSRFELINKLNGK